MATDPVTLSTQWFEQIWNKGNLETASELMAPGCVMHDPSVAPGEVTDAEAFKEIVRTYRQAIPDIHFEVIEMFCEGDRSVLRLEVTGTHSGEGIGPPSNKSIRISGMALGHWRNGQLVEGWNNFDLLSLFEQIGLVERPKT